jgi:hypothetical protein
MLPRRFARNGSLRVDNNHLLDFHIRRIDNLHRFESCLEVGMVSKGEVSKDFASRS